jgi:hypothetical protein
MSELAVVSAQYLAIPDKEYQANKLQHEDNLITLAHQPLQALKILESDLLEDGQNDRARFVYRARLLQDVLDAEHPEKMALKPHGPYC